MTAKTLNLGYLASGLWFTLVFAAVAVAHWKFRLDPILAFWIAYVLTRPVGASYADYVAFPHSVGGLDVGHGPVALVLTFFIVILVGYLAVTRKDVEDPRAAAAPAAPSRHRHAGRAQPGYPPRSARPAAQPPGQQPPPRDQWPPRDEWPPRDQRASQGEWPPRDQRASQGEWPPRDQRASRDEWPPRDQRAPQGEWPPRDQRPGDQRAPRDRRPARDPRPSRRPWDTEAEAEQTAEGFFVWDDQ